MLVSGGVLCFSFEKDTDGKWEINPSYRCFSLPLTSRYKEISVDEFNSEWEKVLKELNSLNE
jgi:hypothetical protein